MVTEGKATKGIENDREGNRRNNHLEGDCLEKQDGT